MALDRAPNRDYGAVLSPAGNQTRRAAVVVELRRAILSGRLSPGERVREIELAEALEVGRPTVRDAAQQLVREGLLTHTPYKGITVSEVGALQVLDIAKVRVALETVAALAVAEDTTRQPPMERAWRRYQDAHSTGDHLDLYDAHMALHRSIWLASRNESLARIWPILDAQISTALMIDQAARADPERAYRGHERLIDAIRSGDRALIESEIEDHIGQSFNDLVQMIGRD